ncbi:zinc-dependent metalloprotease [Salinibacter sp. 10B]|nr:zinc-dependent metalloprotease [Salinibacter sp. 10B]
MRWSLLVALSLVVTVATGCASMQSASNGGKASSQKSEQTSKNGIKPFSKVIPDTAETDNGLITTHRTEDKLYFEIPDSLMGREILMVSRLAQAQSNLAYGGQKANSQVLRWERRDDDLLLRVASYEKTANPQDPVFEAVQNSSFEPILKSFSIEALNEDSTGVVIDATDLYTTDVSSLGLPQSAREEYGVGRLDEDRTYLSGVESFPKNTDVEAILTYSAQNPPSSEQTGTISVEMNHSMVLLPSEPMTPRLCDQRVGYFNIEHINYSSEEQQAAEECFITRWRLEPKDMEAYQNGELVEPKEPIVYYVDPATPEKWRSYVAQGIEDWQEAFRAAGFKNAIVARTPAEVDSTFDPDDIRYSTVRWFASEVPNAYGPHVHDPRSGEILESDIGMYHNVLSLLRNWYFVQTAAVNPEARGRNFDTDVMGKLLQFVVAHEVGHTLGLPHNWGSSHAVPVDSLRSPSYTSDHGTAPSIMDYARFNYIAQPGDGVERFTPDIGVYDRWSIQWGYQSMPDEEGPEAQAQALDEMILEHAGDPRYFYGRQTLNPVDPRSQSEDLGRNAVAAGSLGVANLKRIVPNLVQWTRKDGADYTELEEIYGSVVSQWQRYLNHTTRHVGGVYETFKTYEQDGPVYDPVPAAQQREAMRFLNEQAFSTPEWLVEADVLRRFEASGALNRIREAQVGTLNLLLEPQRMARLLEAEAVSEDAYPLGAMLENLRNGLWSELEDGTPIGPYRRNLQRGYLARMDHLMNAEIESGEMPDWAEDYMIQTPVNVRQSDIRAYVRSELTTLRGQVEQSLRRVDDYQTGIHLEDVLARIDQILDPSADEAPSDEE